MRQWRRYCGRLLVLVLAGAASACATSREAQYAQASTPVAAVKGWTADIEADGLPTQAPPPRRAEPEPDDPREPFSRNYGSPPPQTTGARPAGADAEMLIARAIAAHEQRHP